MKNLLLLIAFVSLSLSSCSAQWGSWKEIKGNGNIETQERRANDFTAVKACCSMEVLVKKGSDHSVSVKADANLMEYIETDVSGGRLVIRTKDGTNINPTNRIQVFVTMPEINSLKSSSSSDLICEGDFTGDELELDVSSSGNIVVSFTGSRVDVESSSSGKIELKGSADKVKFDGSSSSRMDATRFVTKKLDAEASSSAKIMIEVTEEIDADVSSSGRVEYTGNPEKVFSDASSGGKVKKVD